LEKVRFACPRCQTVMQTGSDRVGYDVACPHCSHRFKLISPNTDKSFSSRQDGSLRHSRPAGSADTRVDLVSKHVDSEWALPNNDIKKTNNAGDSFKNENSVGVADSRNDQSAYALPMEAVRVAPGGFCCPYCRSTKPPKLRSKVSTVGWVMFTVLLLTTCVLSPIGLMVRENYRICSHCKITLGGN